MNWFDIAIVVVVAASGLQGRGQEMPRAILPLGGVLAGTIAAGAVYDNLAESLSDIVTNEHDALVVGFLAVFGALYLGSQMLTALSGSVVALLLLGPWTRTAGLLVGTLTGLLLVDTLLIFLVTYPSLGLDGAVQGSALAELFVATSPVMRYLLPGEFDAAAAAF